MQNFVLQIGFGGVFFAHIHVGCGQRIVVQQRGVKRQLGVFSGLPDALAGDCLALGFVVDHQRTAVGKAIHPVQLAEQCDSAQRRLFPDLALGISRATGFMRCKPFQVTRTHPGPCSGKRQKFAARQTQRHRRFISRSVNQSFQRDLSCDMGCIGRVDRFSLQGLMKSVKQVVQPVTKITFAQFGVQLI